jgi:hypothetical protein
MAYPLSKKHNTTNNLHFEYFSILGTFYSNTGFLELQSREIFLPIPEISSKFLSIE